VSLSGLGADSTAFTIGYNTGQLDNYRK